MRNVIGGLVVFLAVFVGIPWFVQGQDFYLTKYFAPRYEQVRHDTYKQSQAYNDGMLQQLSKLKFDYDTATSPAQKDAIASAARHVAASYDITKLPPDLYSFVRQINSGK